MRYWVSWLLLCYTGVACATAAMCTVTEMGSPCAQGGIATLGAAQVVADTGMGNPVDLRSGNKYQRDTDLPSLALAPELELVRHYNAMDSRQGTLGRGWTWSYDTRLYWVGGHPQVIQADGSRVAFKCDERSRCVSAQPARGVITRQDTGWAWRWPTGKCLRFDSAGRLLGWRVSETASVSAATCDGPLALEIVRYQVPSLWQGEIDQIIATTSAQRLRFVYKQQGARAVLAAVESPQGSFRYVFRAEHLVEVSRPDGLQRRYHYEPAWQAGNDHALTGISIADPQAGLVLRTHTWQYDRVGRVHRFIPGSPEVQGAGLPIAFTEAALGLVMTRDAQQRIRGVSLDALGWPGLRLTVDASGQITQWHSRGVSGEQLEYGPVGVAQSVRASASASATEDIQTAVQATRVLSRRFGDQDTWRWDYDGFGRVRTLLATAKFAATTKTQIAWRGEYPSAVVHPEETQYWRLTPEGQLLERRVFRRTEAKGLQRLSHPEWTYRDRFTHDARGRRQTHVLPEGGVLHYEWSGAQLRAIVWENANAIKTAVLQVGALGLIHGNGLMTVRQTGPHHDQGLASDRLEQLLVYQPATRAVVYRQEVEFDHRGVLLRERVQLGDRKKEIRYDYDPALRLRAHLQWRQDSGFSAGRYGWLRTGAARKGSTRDSTGLPTQRGRFFLQYNAQRRLSQAVDRAVSSKRVRYGHNAFAERIWREENQRRTQYLFDQQQLVAEAQVVDGKMKVTRRYIYAQQVPIGLIDYEGVPQAAQLYFFHTDTVGLPRFMTDARQAIRWRAAYSPFGELLEQQHDLGERFAQPLRLPGQVADPLTGWHDNYQRTYDPRWGDYLEPDPLGPVPGNSQYGYAAQQPRRYADPVGLLLFAFDGTGNHPVSQTNVWLFGQQYQGGAVQYIEGPAGDLESGTTTQALEAAVAWSGGRRVDQQWERWLNAVALQRESAQTLALDVVGFSRGAALARHFGNRVAQHMREGRFWLQHPQRGTLSSCVDLRFMGLFDTVAQFNVLGAGNAAFDLSIAPAWKWVAHAVALHEHRWLFPLTSARGMQAAGNVIERAFVGAHADIGGGYLTRQASPGSTPGDLSKVALAWMHWQAKAAGVPLGRGPTKASVLRPIVHDERAVFTRSVQRGDRRVTQPDGSQWANYQDHVPSLGALVRKEVEPLISRKSPLLPAAADAVGWVDMPRYALWLSQTAGWDWD